MPPRSRTALELRCRATRPARFRQVDGHRHRGRGRCQEGRLDGAKKSCKTCHDLYKAKYKEEMRDRVVLSALSV